MLIPSINKDSLYTHVVEPYSKGGQLLKKAWENNQTSSLKERTICLIHGAALLIPVVNTIISIASAVFGQKEVKKEALNTGLRGVVAGICVTSNVDPIKGVSYAGRPIKELAYQDPIEVIYLLLHGKTGSKEEVSALQKDLNERAQCSKKTLNTIHALANMGHSPMKIFSMTLLSAELFEGKRSYKEDCLNVIAKLPQIVAHIINARKGAPQTLDSEPKRGYIENFVHMLNIRDANQDQLVDVMKLFNILHYDHSGGNLSTFVGKSVASGHADMYDSLSAAMSALAGPLHGAANQECLEFVKTVRKQVGDDAIAADVENLIRTRLAKKELVFGFGHAVLRVEDARATVCYDYCNKNFPNDPLVKIAALLRTEGSKVLKENPKISDPYPNIDAITGTMLTAAGFPHSEYYTVLFGMSRCVGIAIQILYEREIAKTPLMRPSYVYQSLQR